MKRWYGSRWGRHRTPAHAGTNLVSSRSRSRTSSIRVPAVPARSSRRNPDRTSASHRTGSSISTASTASSRAAEGGAPASARSASAARIDAGPSTRAVGSAAVPAAPIRCGTIPATSSTSRACSNNARINASAATRPGSSVNPISRATSGWSSATSRSVRRPVSSCTALRARTRNSSASSTAIRSRERSSPAASRSAPTAAAIHPSDATSRRPPVPSFRSGSRRCAQEPNRAARASAASRSRARNDAGSRRARSRTGCIARSAAAASPATGRASSIAVHESNRAAAATHSAGVRTACPIDRPASQSGYRIASTSRATAGGSTPSCRIRRSTSDIGSWMRRPYPPSATSAALGSPPARSQSASRHASISPARRRATHRP